MTTISSVSATANPYQSVPQNSFGEILKDFKAIGSALQAGDPSSAQSALATFQQVLQGNGQTQASQPFGQNSQANTDYQSLVSSIQSGDLSGAQKAFSSLQTDLKSIHKGHHHHHARSAPPASSPTNSASTASAAAITANSARVNLTA